MVEIDNLPLFLTVEECASILRIGLTNTYTLIRSKKLKSVKIGRQYRVCKTDLLQMLNCDNVA